MRSSPGLCIFAGERGMFPQGPYRPLFPLTGCWVTWPPLDCSPGSCPRPETCCLEPSRGTPQQESWGAVEWACTPARAQQGLCWGLEGLRLFLSITLQ